jgi:hypothetical protein
MIWRCLLAFAFNFTAHKPSVSYLSIQVDKSAISGLYDAG